MTERTCRSRNNPGARATAQLRWAVNPPGLLPELTERVGALEQHLRLAQDELSALGDEASWMLREAESAFALALAMIGDELADASLLPARAK